MEEKEFVLEEINKIKQRNNKVEIEKAWETSNFRKILIAVLTYFVVVIFFIFSWNDEPFISAIVPMLGFLLSTLSVSFFKEIWIKYFYKIK